MRKCRVVPFSYSSPPFPNLTHSEVTWHLFVPLECVTGLKNGPAETELIRTHDLPNWVNPATTSNAEFMKKKYLGPDSLSPLLVAFFKEAKYDNKYNRITAALDNIRMFFLSLPFYSFPEN